MAEETILVGFKIGDPGELALETAIDEARRRDARLLVIHSMKGGPLSESETLQFQAHERALEEIDRRLTDEGIEHEVQSFVRGMAPAEDLADIAASEEVSLLVIGHHRRSRTGKYLLGSDTQGILLMAPCPVLVVRTEEMAGD
jgi:nucleotide-binding universal stress UspA family protein